VPRPRSPVERTQRAIQDSNLWPLAPERARDDSHALSPNDTDAQAAGNTREVSSLVRTGGDAPAPNPTRFVTRLLPEIVDGSAPARLLTVGETAQSLGVSRATVYKLVTKGLLPHVRVASAIRIRADELTRFGASLPRRSR
jgi:excisionase family DNA binding protein